MYSVKRQTLSNLSKLNSFCLIVLIFLASCDSFYPQTREMSFEGELPELIQNYFSKDFDYSYIVEKNGKIIYSGNSGYVNKNKKVNNQTLYNVASISKAFTSVGILKLVDQNKLGLDTTLDQIYDNVPVEKAKITIHMLLSHQSGYGDDYLCVGEGESSNALKEVLSNPLETKPATSFKYSNQNYQLLALIIEKISGSKYEDFSRKEILIPLEMSDSQFWEEINSTMNLIATKKKMLKKFGKRDWGYSKVFSCSSDLLRFWNGVYNSQLLSNKSKEIIRSNHYQTKTGLQIGYGFYGRTETAWRTPELYTRGTESWGHNAVIRRFPNKNVTIVVLTNSGEFGKNNMTGNKILSNYIANYLFQ